MFELACGIGFGMNIGDFLQLERTLHGDRIERAAAEEEGGMLVGEALGELLNHAIERESLVDERRQLNETRYKPALALAVGAIVLGKRNHEHPQSGQLRGECL